VSRQGQSGLGASGAAPQLLSPCCIRPPCLQTFVLQVQPYIPPKASPAPG
jgi:hypothetical protein